MKRKLWIIGLILVLAVSGCGRNDAHSDAKVFKESYESLNGTQTDSGKTRLTVNIPADNPVVFATNEEIKELLRSGSGVIYFGFPECPWCRSIIETFLSVCKEQGITKVYYLNNRDERDEKELSETGEVITVKEGTKDYYEILGLLGDYADEYIGLENPDIRRLYFPTVVVVKDGKILGTQVSAVDGFTDPYLGMTDSQKEELAGIYRNLIGKLLSCDLDDKC